MTGATNQTNKNTGATKRKNRPYKAISQCLRRSTSGLSGPLPGAYQYAMQKKPQQVVKPSMGMTTKSGMAFGYDRPTTSPAKTVSKMQRINLINVQMASIFLKGWRRTAIWSGQFIDLKPNKKVTCQSRAAADRQSGKPICWRNHVSFEGSSSRAPWYTVRSSTRSHLTR